MIVTTHPTSYNVASVLSIQLVDYYRTIMMWYVVSMCGESIEDMYNIIVAYDAREREAAGKILSDVEEAGEVEIVVIGPGGGTYRIVVIGRPGA